MSKKVKLVYNFNRDSNLEVQIPSDTWCRVTSSDFRSSGFPRRINGELYNGVVYYKDTNIIVDKPENGINYAEGYIRHTSTKKR